MKIEGYSKAEWTALERWSEWYVDCITCKSKALERCRNTKDSYKYAKPHKARVKAYIEYDKKRNKEKLEIAEQKKERQIEAEILLNWLDNLLCISFAN